MPEISSPSGAVPALSAGAFSHQMKPSTACVQWAMLNVWQRLLPCLFSTRIWEPSKQMHTHLHFLGRRAENLRILVGSLRCSENLTHHAHNIKECLLKTRPSASLSLCCLASHVFDAFYESVSHFSLWTGGFRCPGLPRVYFISNNDFHFIRIYCCDQRRASLFRECYQ